MTGAWSSCRRFGRCLAESSATRPATALTNRAHRPGMTSIRSRCHLADDSAMLAQAFNHAGGYSLMQWRDAVPEEIIDDVSA